MVAIETFNLTKDFGKFRAVDGLNLKVEEGEIYGFLGPNGAGKTTTIRMLTGTMRPTFGEIRILGLDMKKSELEIKKMIGVAPEEPKIYPYLKGHEFLSFVCEIYGLDKNQANSRIRELCEAFSVDYLDKLILEMSHGMKQKLILISVLMRKPKVIFLDEPTVGLDAKSARILKMLLLKYSQEGCTIFMTTHIMEIAEKMCQRIGIINSGRLIAEGTMEQLRLLSKTTQGSLEDIFLKLTSSEDNILQIVKEL
ncbi:ABC transporter ATP-binding protein [Pseudothermotoga thermarum]|uniref:ABC transporter related protein n=1 Tax=Pseudothermotoga thermarum DSM 5069 TaxID=688269 RepID=F7YYL1_9THEM|nr:ABC transporter ATP-binding protein [Pseudothermotoga thermarum]AEH51043.1 ABC transporter related protein [Pseudothermotoga thermarum DSM 5069]